MIAGIKIKRSQSWRSDLKNILEHLSGNMLIKLGLAWSFLLLLHPMPMPTSENRWGKGKACSYWFIYVCGESVGIEGSVPINDPSNSAFSNESFQTNPTIAQNLAIGYSFPEAWGAELEYVGYFADSTNKFTLTATAKSI